MALAPQRERPPGKRLLKGCACAPMLRERFIFAINSKLFLQDGFGEGIRYERPFHEGVQALALLSRRAGHYRRRTEPLQKSEMPSDVLVGDSEHI